MAEIELSFLNYFQRIGGQGMYFDKATRIIKVMDYNDNIIEIHLANRVPAEFKMIDALRKSVKEGDVDYYIFENGVQDKNWLYPLTLETVIKA